MKFKPTIPALCWLLLLPLLGTERLLTHWEDALVLFVALACVPLALRLIDVSYHPILHWISTAGLCAGYLCMPGIFASACVTLYALWAAWIALHTGLQMLVYGKSGLSGWVRVFALGYWAVGAIFALFVVADYQPFHFDRVIVGLTAAHFHMAGFVLTAIVYALWRYEPHPLHRLLCWAALLGMPLVAIGIVLTKLGFPPVLEWVSALLFAVTALTVAGRQYLVFRDEIVAVHTRRFLLAGSLSLLCGGVLAVLYAMRFAFPLAWITIPNMKIWHGTINAIGFGWLSLWGWNLVSFKPIHT